MISTESADIAVKTVALIVAIAGVWQYYDSVQQSKFDRTFTYSDELYSTQVFQARRDLGALLYGWLERKRPDGQPLTREQFDALTVADLSKPENSVKVDTVLEFFDRMRVCVEGDACAESAAKQLLADEAEAIYIITEPYLTLRRRQNEVYGRGLLCFDGQLVDKECFP